jgi:hypothetical protein
MKFRLLLAAGLMFMTFLTSFTPDFDRSTSGAWISSGSHAALEMTDCDELFHARDLLTDDTVDWYINNVYAGSTRDIYATVYEGDEIKIIVNPDDSNYTYEYYDTIIACED